MENISRSEQKRRYKQLEDVAKELVGLSNKDLKKFPGSEEVKEEIVTARPLKAGARKRQIKYLTKLLRQDSVDEIYDFLSTLKGSRLKEKTIFHEAERLRDTMINEAMEDYQYCRKNNIEWEPGRQCQVIDQAVASYKGLNPNAVQKLVYQYVKTRNKLHYRELFRTVLAAIEQEEMRKRLVGNDNP